MRRLLVPWPRRASADRHGADRVVPDANACAALRQTRSPWPASRRRRRRRAAKDRTRAQRRHRSRSLRGRGRAPARLPAVRNRNRRPRRQRRAQAAGAVVEFTQRDFVAQRRIRMIDPRQHFPRRRARPRRDRPCVGAALRQRLDGKAVIGGADQALKRRALEHRVDQLAPLFARGGREISGEQTGFRGRSWSQNAMPGGQGQYRRDRGISGRLARRQLLDAACVPRRAHR